MHGLPIVNFLYQVQKKMLYHVKSKRHTFFNVKLQQKILININTSQQTHFRGIPQ